MTCKICGKQLPEGSTVCKYCGARVKSAGTSGGRRRRYSKKGMARKRTINLIIALLAVLLIAAVVAGIIWSVNQVGKAPENGQADGNETAQEAPAEEDEPPVIPEDEQEPAEEPEETPEEQPEETPEEQPEETPEETPEEQPEETQEEQPQEQPEETPEEAPQETPEQAPAEQPSTEGYTLGLNRTETTASLNHYRELEYYFNQELPAGVTVSSTSWVSSNDSVVRAEEGRAWGVSLGEATVTVTVNLSNGDALSAQCLVHVVESQIVTYSDYILPESATRLYSAEELSALSDNDLYIARNEIYARHGRIFTNPTLQQYFSGKSWYSGTIAPENFDYSVLNSYERQNVNTILAVEASR